MARNDDLVEFVGLKRRERCHLCGGLICLHHYGVTAPTGWEIDHDVPRAAGGDDDLDNLEPAHVSCNRSKQALPSDLFRAQFGLDRPPMSVEELLDAQRDHRTVGGVVGAMIGATVDREKPARGLLVGAFVGLLLGAAIAPGYEDDV
jgi:hypothetical protein